MRTTHYAFPPAMIFTAEILAFITALLLTILAVAHLADKKDRPDTTIPKDKQ